VTAIDALRAVLTSEVGKQTLLTLADGQGTNTDDGMAWLSANRLLDAHDAVQWPHAQEKTVWVEFDDGEMWFAGVILWLWEASWDAPRLAIADQDDAGNWLYENCRGVVGECGETYPTHCSVPVVPLPPNA